MVLFATLTPLDGIEPIGWEFADKAIHLGIFLLLTFLLYLAYPEISRWNIALLMIFYGLLIEILQHILPLGRSFDWYDWVFDIIGVLIGFAICYHTNIPQKFRALLNALIFKRSD